MKTETELLRNDPTKKIINISIKLLALSFMLIWCFKILEPFITIIVWSAVLAVSLYPLQQLMVKKLKLGNKMASALVTILMLALIIAPAVWLTISTVGEIKNTVDEYKAGNISVPVPPESVKDLPVIGGKVYEVWTDASNKLIPLIQDNMDKIKIGAIWFFGALASTGKGLALLTAAIIISGFLIAFGKTTGEYARLVLHRISGNKNHDMADIAAVTIRNVVKGILGVAFIQSALACIGFVAAGIPAPGLWTLFCLILAIVQLGTFPVAICVIIYAWNHESTTVAIVFTIWMVLVSVIDNILKPIMLGKGAPVPMLVVFLGAIGGFILSGFIGLFTGAVVLSLGYGLFNMWLHEPAE
jgi:predicted PurR-regulated permease PerM